MWGFFAIGLGLLLVGSWRWRRIERSRQWPAVRARVVEEGPSTLLEGGRLNLDSDHFLEYEVDGQTYRHRIGDEAFATVGGVKVWRKKPPRNLAVRVSPQDPRTWVRTDASMAEPMLYIAIGVVVLLVGLASGFDFVAVGGGSYEIRWDP